MKNITSALAEFTVSKAMHELQKKYHDLLLRLSVKGQVYIWGTGMLGAYAFAQCAENGIEITGHIDNDPQKWSVSKKIYSCEQLKQDDIVIIASLYYPQIIEQVQSLGIERYIYYEELAYLVEGMETYYPAFRGVFEDLEYHKKEYEELQEYFADELSKEIYLNILSFKATLDIQYAQKARKLSEQEGTRNFDKVICSRLDTDYFFYDAGGYDGDSTLNFINRAGKYNKIYFFEPDKNNIKHAQERLKDYSNIIYINAGVGEKNGYENFNAIGGASGFFSADEMEHSKRIGIVTLDEFVRNHKSYIKMDIEGYEVEALRGARKAIKSYQPLMSISAYHKPDDLYRIIPLVLSWNPEYKIYLRHYTDTYTDTDIYFVM